MRLHATQCEHPTRCVVSLSLSSLPGWRSMWPTVGACVAEWLTSQDDLTPLAITDGLAPLVRPQ